MDAKTALLCALHADPSDETTWLALADCLEEQGRPERAELLRLRLALRTLPRGTSRQGPERRAQELLSRGVEPSVPVLVNSLGMRLVLISPGEFWMGSPREEEGRDEDEGPEHRVEFRAPFYAGAFLVTQRQYEAVMGNNPARFREGGAEAAKVEGQATADFPVEGVLWQDAAAFCRTLSDVPAEKAAGRVYRLPTEAEWEYVCRAGTTTAFTWGPSLAAKQANLNGRSPYAADEEDSPGRPTPVGSYRPNLWGLYDVHGNLWEWCNDWFDEHYYERSPHVAPAGPEQGDRKVLRGGGWRSQAVNCRSAYRNAGRSLEPMNDYGFRVVCGWAGATRPAG